MSLEPAGSLRSILMTTDTVGGVWNYALELSRELGRRGIRVQLATMGAPLRPAQREQLRALPLVRASESHFALEWMENPWEDVARAAEWLWELEEKFSPDLVHLNSYAHASVPFAAPVLVVAHSCVLSWWGATRGTPPPDQWARYAKAVRQGLHAAGCVVAPTTWMAKEISSHYGLSKLPRVIANGRSAKDYFPASKEPMILSIGRLWDEAKNVQALSAIAADLPWRVVVAGDNRSPEGMETSFSSVESIGFLSETETAKWMGRASVYVSPARYEPFGLSILEAALSGCALVLGDIHSLRELWDGVAQFVRPDDLPALRASCLELINDPAKRVQRGEAARQRALEFSSEKMAERYLELYETMVRSERPTSTFDR